MELMLVFVVALLVIGPDKLPGAVRTGSLWIGRFRRSYNKVKSEIERELNTDEIKRQLHNEAVLEEIEAAKQHVKKIADETKVSVDSLVSSTHFDPGASSATESQAVRELEGNSIAPGMTSTKPAQEQGKEQEQEAPAPATDEDAGQSDDGPEAAAAARTRPSYGGGSNPKLASKPASAAKPEPEPEPELATKRED